MIIQLIQKKFHNEAGLKFTDQEYVFSNLEQRCSKLIEHILEKSYEKH